MRPSRLVPLSLAGLAIVVAAIALLAYALVRLAWFERNVSGWLSDRLGLPVTLGELAIGYFPEPWIEVDNLTVAQSARDDAASLIELGAARVELPWRTVFGRSLRVDRVELAAPRLRLSLDASGEPNWRAFADALAALGGGDAPARWSIGSLEFEGGALTYRDARDGAAVELTGVASSAREVAPGESFPLRLRLAGQATDYTFHAAIETFASLDPDRDTYAADELTFRGWLGGGDLGLGGVELAGRVAEIRADLAAGTVGIHELTFDGLGLQLAGDVEVTGLDARPDIAFALVSEPFAPRAVANSLNAPLPATADPTALARASARLRGRLNETGLAITELRAEFDDSVVEGSLLLPASDAPPQVRLTLDRIRLDRYLPPADAADPPASPQAALESMLAAARDIDVDAEIVAGEAEARDIKARDLRIVIAPNDTRPAATGR